MISKVGCVFAKVLGIVRRGTRKLCFNILYSYSVYYNIKTNIDCIYISVKCDDGLTFFEQIIYVYVTPTQSSVSTVYYEYVNYDGCIITNSVLLCGVS